MPGTGVTPRRGIARRLLARFGPDLGAERWLIGWSFLTLGAEVLFKSLEPWPLKLIIDHLLRPGATGWGGFAPDLLIAAAGLGLVAVVSLRAASTYSNTLGFSLAGNRLIAAVRLRMVDHLQRLSLAFHQRSRSGDLLQRLSRDLDLLKEVLVTALLPLVGNGVTLLFLGGVMWWMNWRLAIIGLAVLPIFGLVALRVVPRIHEAARNQRRREGASAAALNEALGAIRVVQSMSLEGVFAGAMARHERAAVQDDVGGRILAARLERSVDILTAVASAAVLGWGAHLARAGLVSVGELVVFLSYLKSVYKPIQDLAKYLGRLAKAMAAGERILDVFDATPDIVDRPDAIDAGRLAGAIEFDQVSFRYHGGQPVLDRVSLAIEAGECVALVGPSGHGKSTLGSLLLRLYDPTAGTVAIDGVDVRRYRVASLRRQISVVPQDSLLFGVSVRDNIRHGNPSATDQEIEAAARMVNAHAFISALPNGYQTVLGERGGTVSSGQRQRIALARAAVGTAPILVLDEPTTGLDGGNRLAVCQAIAALARGRTTVMITHDEDLVRQADRVFRLADGRLEEEGCRAFA